MKNALVISLLALAVVAPSIKAGNPPPQRRENGPDTMRRYRKPPNIPNMPDAAASPSNADVGDGDSFGRSVNYLGFTVVAGALVWWDCTDYAPGQCLNPADAANGGGGSVSYIGEDAVIKLPARSSRSLLCFNFTNFGWIQFINESPTRQGASGTLMSRWRIDSEVLADPSLINANTGLPFNGSITSAAFLSTEYRNLDPGEQLSEFPTGSRSCLSGHLSRRGLIEMGLSEAQAREVFRKPITIHFGASVQTTFAQAVSSYGVRIYGD